VGGAAIPVYIELVEIERKLSDGSQLWRDIQAAAEFGLTDERSPLSKMRLLRVTATLGRPECRAERAASRRLHAS